MGEIKADEERQFGVIQRDLEEKRLDLVPIGTLSLGKSLNLPDPQCLCLQN
jgi:hypothetical protein